MNTDEKQSLIRSDSGLTLIELMAAMVILVVGAIAALSILVEAHKSNAMARAKTMAVNAAEEQLEIIYRMKPSDVMDRNGQWFPVPNLPGPGPLGEAGLITVTGGATPKLPDTITITVSWTGQGTLPTGNVSISALRSTINRD